MSNDQQINIVGIDLGTTFSALASLNMIGKSEIVVNADGERLTPSVVFFDEDDNNTVRVGIEALNSRHINPKRSARWIKRHIGDKKYRLKIDGKNWSAVELSSLILQKLKQECISGDGQESNVVISVPAHFDEIRRKETMDAGAMAGLNVIGIVNEPVAAALYYATMHPISGNILVYDLGGGTFDVTIMKVNGQQMDIVCSQGEHALGGIDFDAKIVEMLEQCYKDKYGTKLINSDEDRVKYEDEAEDIKKTLTRRDVARKIIYGADGSLRVDISRKQFEDAISVLIGRTEMLLETALDEAGMKAGDIDKVILAGGSTRIPLIHKHLEKMFGSAPEMTINVDECVALGAALHAGLTMVREKSEQLPAGISNGLKDIKLTDVCNHSYGTICAPLDEQTGKHVLENHILLQKNTPLPCEVSETFYTMTRGQTELKVTVTQGEDTNAEYINKITTHTLNLPPNRPAGCPIKVTYSYDVNQRMHCEFEDVESGKALKVDLSIDENDEMSQSNVDKKGKKVKAVKVK